MIDRDTPWIAFAPATGRNTQAHWVNVLGLKILFSYSTPVAFSYYSYTTELSTHLRRHNDWGPTTGRHMRECGMVAGYVEISDAAEFNRRLNACLSDVIASMVSLELQTSLRLAA